MLELIARNDTSISTINNQFSIGQQDTIKIWIEDKVLKEQIETVDTGVCNPEYNYYSYGYFLEAKDIDNVALSLNTNCNVTIDNTIFDNANSNSLHLVSNNEKGIGTIRLSTDCDIVSSSNEFIFSFNLLVKSGTVNFIITDSKGNTLSTGYNQTTDIGWTTITTPFTLDETVKSVNLQLSMPNTGEAYVNAVSFFNKENETKNINYDLDVEIVVANPYYSASQPCINNIITWGKDDKDNLYVLLALPEITYVDANNNILCRLVITQKLKEKVSDLGNIIYNKTQNVVYNSEPFTLSGQDTPMMLTDNIDENSTDTQVASAKAVYDFVTDTLQNDKYQSDWNTNDDTNPSYVKNRPFYSEKIESDVWEFELPVVNESTGEGAYPAISMPDADFSQFTNGQELEYEVYASGELQDSGTSVFIKSVDVRKMFENATEITIDADVPNTLMGIGSDAESVSIIFGITIELTDFAQGVGVIHNTPNFCWVDSISYDGNAQLPVQVKFKNFRNIVEQIHQIPDKYINWDNYVNNKKWKWEFHVSAMPFTTQPTIVTGNVSKLKADTFYFIKYMDSTETTFKLTYGEDVFVDNTLEFNRNNAWSSSDDYKFIHCISVDIASNTAVFGKPYPSDALFPCIVPNNTKSLRIQISAKAVNMDIKNSPFPKYTGTGAWGTGIFVLADGKIINGNNYETYGCFASPYPAPNEPTNNSISIKDEITAGQGMGIILPLAGTPACIIDLETEAKSKLTHPQYEGLLQYDVNLIVSANRRSYNMEGNVAGVCWNSIDSVTLTTPLNVADIKASYPTQCYSQLQSEDKKLFFKTNEANNIQTQLAIAVTDNTLAGFSITIEGEVE